jgi:hypothetical protein
MSRGSRWQDSRSSVSILPTRRGGLTAVALFDSRRWVAVAFWRNRDNRVRVGLRFYVFVAEGLSRVSSLCRSDYVSTFRGDRVPERDTEPAKQRHDKPRRRPRRGAKRSPRDAQEAPTQAVYTPCHRCLYKQRRDPPHEVVGARTRDLKIAARIASCRRRARALDVPTTSGCSSTSNSTSRTTPLGAPVRPAPYPLVQAIPARRESRF